MTKKLDIIRDPSYNNSSKTWKFWMFIKKMTLLPELALNCSQHNSYPVRRTMG